MTATLWFLLGAFIGVDAALAYAWLTTRRTNRNILSRVRPYTGTLTFDTPAARRALQRRRSW